MTAGEKRVARLLESQLEDDYYCWYDTPVGIRQRYTDFIVLNARRGVVLLEVKDWKLTTIYSANRHQFTLEVRGKLKKAANPLAQVRACSHQLVKSLESDPALRQNGKFEGKLVCPYGIGVVLTNITRQEYMQAELDNVLPPHQTICKDDLEKTSNDAEAFQKLLWDMIPYTFETPLSLPQINRVRWHMFPEIRLKPPKQLLLEGDADQARSDSKELFPDVIKVMDTEQEKLARNLGEGHRVIHGVAGSGKTLILAYRCRALASEYEKPILVVCFNVTLAAMLREMTKDIENKVNVVHFHDWCGQQLRTYHVAKPNAGPNYLKELVTAVLDGVEKEQIPKAQYSAVMIDEGHDFQADWLKLVVRMIDLESDSLLMLYDDAQSLYKKKNQLEFSLSSVGIQARGRTTVLAVNYRNTDEVLGMAYKFIAPYLAPSDVESEQPIVEPTSAGRTGPKPVLKLFSNFEEEAKYIAETIAKVGKSDGNWSGICITYRSKWMGDVLSKILDEHEVPTHWLRDTRQKSKLSKDDERVKLMTMHSSKGLEFPLVVVAGVGEMPAPKQDKRVEAKLLYVAMTRSTENLLITAGKKSEFYNSLAA